jgi:magnesium-transporting ATPase (P-type)
MVASACTEERRAWHAAPIDAAVAELATSLEGLDDAEQRERLARFGANRLANEPSRSALSRLLAQFHDVLIHLLIVAGIATALLGHGIDSSVIFGVVLVNAWIGFVQEGKAERALDAIRSMLAPRAVVVRAGKTIEIPAEDLVPGDIVKLRSGDKVPADLRLLRTRSLQIDEAALTGESLPAEKTPEPVAAEAPLGDRSSMAYAGTLVTSGRGIGVVVATGAATEIGLISTMVGAVETVTTPLLRQLTRFGQRLSLAILVLAAVTFAFGLLRRGYSATEMFLASVGLAVAAIPEGLPAILTITLAIGVQRMARQHAIIRRLPAVETLGSVTVICSDKTGTLTRNEMTVQTVVTRSAVFTSSGVGYAPDGGFSCDDLPIAPAEHPLLAEMMRGALLCSDAVVRRSGENWILEGAPTEGALVTAAMKADLDPDAERKRTPRTDLIPFESEHRFMATLHHDHEGRAFVYVKGAPERLLEMCSWQRGAAGDEPLESAHWKRRMTEVAERGQRLLAIATRRCDGDRRELCFGDVERELTLLGFFGLADPPRREAIEAVTTCRQAGIRVKMITGDHAETARAIGRELGLDSERVLTGRDVEALDDAALARAAAEIDVFARASPKHKLRLVEALQARDQVVAMTGDGVNDAPALKRADVGIAMGHKGTDAAKEASAMVLADDNFVSITSAVEEGRTVYDNLKKAITFILPTNGGEALVLVAAIALGRTLPMTPVQILWVNMITAVTLALALAFDPPEPGVMRRPPRAPDEPLLSRFLLWRIGFVSMILLLGTFGQFVFEREAGASIERARTVAVNTLVLFEIFYLWNARHLRAPVLNREGLFGSRPALLAIGLVLGFQIAFTYAPPMQFLFGTEALDAVTWVRILAVASSVLFLVELEKWGLRHRDRRRPGRRQAP